MAYDVNIPADDLAIADIPDAIRTKGADVKSLVDAHISDTTSAHTASSIANVAAGGISATDVQAAINELDTEKAPKASPAFTGTVSGISGSMISNTPAGNISATTTQAAINELDTEKVAHAISTAANDFVVGSGSNTLVKKTLAETKTILGISNVTNNAQVKKVTSSTDNAVIRWDGTSGDTPQDSLVTISDVGSVNIPNGQTYQINGTSLNSSHVGAIPSTYLDTDTSLTANSDVKVATQKAVKSYVSTAISANTTLVSILQDVKSVGTSGGKFENGAWRVRDLNTYQINQLNLSSTFANSFDLPAGTYEIIAYCPAYDVASNQAALYNVTSSSYSLLGSCQWSPTDNENGSTNSIIHGIIEVTTTSTFQIHHRSVGTSVGTNGFGRACGFTNEVYTQVIIKKIGG